jgi:hypothetical protein
MNINHALDLVRTEYYQATAKFPPYHSPHEGYGIIAEEFRELETEVFKRDKDYDHMFHEALQVATTAIRFITDLDGGLH